MAKASLSSLVERLAEAESHLGKGSGDPGGSSSGGGNSSQVLSEERNSAVADDLEKASDVSRRSNRSDFDSNAGRPHGYHAGSSGSNISSGVGGKRGDESGSLGSLVDSTMSERLSALLSNPEDVSSNHSDKAKLARDILQQLAESQEAQKEADERLRQTEQALSSLQSQHQREMADMQVALTRKDQEKVQTNRREQESMKQDRLSIQDTPKQDHCPVHSSSSNEPQLKSGLGQDVGKQDPFYLPDAREEENALLRKQLRAARQQLVNVENERDVLRRNMKLQEESHSNQVASLKAQIQAARAQQDGADQVQGLMKQLDLMQAQNQEMLEELSELRLRAPKEQVKKQVGDLQMMLDTASLKLEQTEEKEVLSAGGAASSPHLLNKPNAANKRKNMNKKMGSALSKLDAIEEDLDSVNESCNPTFTVSSDAGGGGVGDMDDFDDEVEIAGQAHSTKAMQDALKQEKRNVQMLQEELASKEANYISKIGRLTEQLQTARKHQASTQEEVVAMKQMVGEDAQRTSQMDSLSKLLEAAQAKNAAYEELSQQVATLKESKRITEARVEDLKHALISEERKHQRVKDELAHKLIKAGSDAPEDDEVEELRNRLRNAEEERNVLCNNFEGKEVKYTTEIEDMKQEVEEVKRRHNADIRKLAADKEALEITLKDARERQAPVREPVAPVVPQNSLLSLLRCPIRNSGGSEGSRAKPAYCQDMCWKVVSAISGTVALWCSMGDYTILQASREANRIWGSATLQGKSMFALASGPSSAAWLRKAFNAHQRIAEMETGDRGPLGFVVRDLGCEAFITKDGTSFDSSVITAHFPREVALNKESALLVIMEPQNRGFSGPSAPHSSRSQAGGRNDSRMRSGRQRSGTSEVSASSVSPSDSASNVIGRMW